MLLSLALALDPDRRGMAMHNNHCILANLLRIVLAANGLYKRELFSMSPYFILSPISITSRQPNSLLTAVVFPEFPDPFAVITIDGSQTQTTQVIKKTLNPFWNQSFDLYAYI